MLFSLARTKLPSYVTPCYPALAILVACFVDRWSTSGIVSLAWLRVSFSSLFLVGIGLGVGLPVAARRFLPGGQWLGMIGLVPVLGSVFCWWSLRQQRHRQAACGLAGSAMAFSFLMMAVLPAEVGSRQRYELLLQRTRADSGPLVAFGHLEPTWIFYGGRSIRYFDGDETQKLAEFLRDHEDTAVITTRPRLAELRQKTDIQLETVASTPYFLRDRELVLAKLDDHRLAAEPPESLSR